MNQELELSEQLIEAGFTSFGDIDDLDENKILEEETFNYVFSIENKIVRERNIAKLQLRAKALKVTKQFNSLLKVYREKYIKSQKRRGSNKTEFKDCPYQQLNCGDWIANETGIFKEDCNNIGNTVKVKASSIPVIPVERLENVDTGIEKIKLAFFKDGKWKELMLERNTIASKSKILQLANRGLEVTEDNAKNLITYLADIIELNTIPLAKSITHLGWLNKDFIPYTNNYVFDSEDIGLKKIYNSVKAKGDYDIWKKLIIDLRKNNKALRFMIASSFASPLVKIFNINTFMVHLWGISGNGKTVTAKICTSIWGDPEGDYMSTLNSTAVATERMCDFFRNMPLILDELQLSATKYKNNDEVIYGLTEGKGKDRGNIEGGINQKTEWQNIVILNGEKQITSENSDEGAKNRVIEINEEKNIVEDGNAVCNSIADNYGFAGQDFINIIKEIPREDLYSLRNMYVEELKKITSYKKQINAMSCVLVADYIVSQSIFKDNSLTVKDVQEYFRNDTDEADRIMQMLIDDFSVNANKFYSNIDEADRISGEIWGKVEKTSEKREILAYYITQSKLVEILKEKEKSWNAIKGRMAKKEYIDIRKYMNDGKEKIEYTVREKMKEGIRNVVKLNVFNFLKRNTIDD